MNAKLNLRIILAAFFLSAASFAQNNNAEKILGCWKLKSMESMEIEGDLSALPQEAVNSVVCFLKDGKFTTQLSNDKDNIVHGTYSFSDDGKTIYQQRDINDHGVDDELQVRLLDETHLEIQTQHIVITFDKV